LDVCIFFSLESGVESGDEDAVNSSEGAESANLLLPQGDYS